MTKHRFVRRSSQTLVVRLLTVSTAIYATTPTVALAQLPSNWDNTGHAPFSTCARNSPARTTLNLSTRAMGTGVRATTDAPFFGPADIGQVIVLTRPSAAGRATITEFTDSSNVTVEITQGFGPALPYGPGTWSRWPICYMRLTGGKYGFNAGVGHQKGTTTLTLGFDGQRYSVDRCSLAHDSYFWGPDKGDPGLKSDACSNNYWVGFCFGIIDRKTREEEEAYNWLDSVWQVSLGLPARVFRPAVLPGWRAGNPCATKRDWIELPDSSHHIPAASCYRGAGRVLLGLNGKALDVSGGDLKEGAKVIVWDRNKGCNQLWRMVPGPQSASRWGYELRGVGGHAGMCLGTPPGTRPRPGHTVQMWRCNARYTYTQRWHHEHGQIRVQDRRTPRLCLDVDEQTSPRIVFVAKCASINPRTNPSQQWRFVAP